MDPVTIIFLILFLVLPALSRLLETRKTEGERQQQRREAGSRPLPGPPHHRRQPGPAQGRGAEAEMEIDGVDDPLADALRQIREALGHEEPSRPTPQPRPAPTPEPAPVVEPPVPAYTRPQRERRLDVNLRENQAPLKVETVSSSKNFRTRLARELTDPEAARHAVIMKEIFDPPLVIRRRRSRK